MRVVRVELEGLTTSFRYPFFVVGRQPTYDMPPPATIYGHICSAAGELLDPGALSFAYCFTHAGKSSDLEHAHVVRSAVGRMVRPGTMESVPKVMEGAVNPLSRDFFFLPKLTLYVAPPELEGHFRSPRYPVVLGRSQDLASYVSVNLVELERASIAYYEHTLLPVTLGTAGRGIGITMPRFVDPGHGRAPTFSQYVMMPRRIRAEEAAALAQAGGHWVDPESPEVGGAHRGLAFLTFADGS